MTCVVAFAGFIQPLFICLKTLLQQNLSEASIHGHMAIWYLICHPLDTLHKQIFIMDSKSNDHRTYPTECRMTISSIKLFYT